MNGTAVGSGAGAAAVTLPRAIANDLLDQARRAPEREICGLIAARDGGAVRCYPVANIAEHPACRYVMDPRGQIDALREMRERGEELFAIYHSHPRSPAQPSLTDIREAGYPEALYLIISLDTEGVLEMRGFRIAGGRVAEVALEI